MINRENYESYLLDLLEGRLSAEEQQALSDFLMLHPDCSAGIESLEPWILEKSRVSFPRRELLKKELPGPRSIVAEHNFDLFSIARLEGDLIPEQEDAHQALAEGNERLGKEWEMWKHTRLLPEPVSYPRKSELRRRQGIDRRFLWITIAASAAAVLLLLILILPGPRLNESGLADTAADPGQETMTEPSVQIQGDPDNEALRVETVPLLPSEGEVVSLIQEEPEGTEAEVHHESTMEYGTITDLVQNADPGRTGPAALRIAAHARALHSVAAPGRYDRISPLELEPVPVHQPALSLSQIGELDLQNLFDDFTQENNISLWTIANAGFKGINWLTGSEMSIMASRDDQGEVSGFRFTSRRFTFTAPLNPSD